MRSTIVNRKQSGGTFDYVDVSKSTGEHYFVSSVRGTAGNSAKNPDSPETSVIRVIANNTLAVGDTIWMMPGHAEPAITAAGGVTIPAGVTVASIGYGNNRGTFTFSTANTATILMSGAGASIRNAVIDCTGFAAIAKPVNVTAADCQITGCYFITNNATNQAVSGITSAAGANNMLVDSCDFMGTTDAGVTAAIIIVGGDHIRITNNTFVGAYSSGVGAIQNVTTACTNLVIRFNDINNQTASCTKAIVAVSTTTGIVSSNGMQILSGTAPITAAAMSWVGSPANYYAATIGTIDVIQ